MPKIFKPYQKKICAGFLGGPKNFADTYYTQGFLQKKFPEIEKIFCPLQTHTKKIFETEYFCSGQPSDGVCTSQKKFCCTVKNADCIGALFYNPQKNIVASIHAGWRGLAQKIFTNFLQNFPPSERKNFLVALSPSLKKCCAEFSDPYNETPKFFHPEIEKRSSRHPRASEARAGDLFFIDLPQVAKNELLQMGISEKNIEIPKFCTQCEGEKKFWSHRRGDKQRNISYIFIR